MSTAATTLEIQAPHSRQIVNDAPAMSASPITSTLERVVMDPNLPVERVEKVLALYYQAEDRAREQAREDAAFEAQKAYFAAMSACQKELPVVVKNKRNDHTKSNYADLAAIEEQAMPVIHKHGFGVSFQPNGYNDLGELQIKWRITHSGGHMEGDIAGIPVDGAGAKGNVNKTGTQAFGSTATYGRRYLLCMLFNISTGDDRDGNRAEDNGGLITPDQRNELQDLVERLGWNVPEYCEWLKIDALADLDARYFAREKQRLETKIRVKGSVQ